MKQYKRVLVVDDEKSILRMLSLFLTNKGYLVETASDGQEALNAIKDFWPDVLVLDVMMPKLNGYRVSRMVKLTAEMNPSIPEPKVILITARDLSQDSEREEAMGSFSKADAVLYKPFRPTELLAKIEALCP